MTLGRQLSAIGDVTKYLTEVEHMLETKLAPIKYSKALFELSSDKIIVKNVSSVIERVEQWCSEVRQILKTDYINMEVE